MRCFSWLVGSLLALTVVTMDANQGLAGLADKLHTMHLSSGAESIESSSSRPGTTLNSAAMPYEPKRARGKGAAAAHFNPATVDTVQSRLEKVGQSLKDLISTTKTITGVFGPDEVSRIDEVISALFSRNHWAPGSKAWMRTKMSRVINGKSQLATAFDDLLTQLARLWTLNPKLNVRENLKQMLKGFEHDDLRTLYQAAEDLEALALLWNRKSELVWPPTEHLGPFLDATFAEHNDAHLAVLCSTIRDQVGAIIKPERRIEALPNPEFVPLHWTREKFLVNGFEKRMWDLETLYFWKAFSPNGPERQQINHSRLAKKRTSLKNAQSSIRDKLASDAADQSRFGNLIEWIENYDSQAEYSTLPHTVLTAPHQPVQASPGEWVVASGIGQNPLMGQVQHGAVFPNHQDQHSSAHAIAHTQPGGHYGGHPVGYPGGYSVGYPGGYHGNYPGGYHGGYPAGYHAGYLGGDHGGYPGGYTVDVPGGGSEGPLHLPNPGYNEYWYGHGPNA